MDYGAWITEITGRDVRFPTSLEADGSDAMHVDPDYSCVYVTVTTSNGKKGYGFTFTIGRGTEIVLAAVKALFPMVLSRRVGDIFDNFSSFWRELTSDTQLRWIGPEKGVIHLATAAIVNALWDLWARVENKPLWKLLVDMEPEKLVSTIDFRYITDVITKEEAIEMLKRRESEKHEKVAELLKTGYPVYCTSVGWIGYSEEKIRELCKSKIQEGFTRFKAKVGQDLESDKKRLSVIRQEIGWDNALKRLGEIKFGVSGTRTRGLLNYYKESMVDANQKWDVQEAICWMRELAPYKLTWIEEPTSPDDILGHATIAKALNPLGIGVATGEQCQNRVMFKQFLQANALQYCQIDSCRLGGVNEILAVYLMAAKFNVPVCPHAGGVGLCELVQHLSAWDYISVSGSLNDRMIEYVEHLHEHFKTPVIVENGCYRLPLTPGYSCEMKEESLTAFEYPNGSEWLKLFESGRYQRPIRS